MTLVTVLVAHLLGALIFVSQLFIAPRALAGETRSPDATAALFYGWYLHALTNEQDPLHDNPSKFATFVSKDLIVEIERRINSADGLDEDYFIHAQDYLDDWPTHISTSKPVLQRGSAVVLVTLGSSVDSRRQLKLTLVQEGGAWKIRKVQLA